MITKKQEAVLARKCFGIWYKTAIIVGIAMWWFLSTAFAHDVFSAYSWNTIGREKLINIETIVEKYRPQLSPTKMRYIDK